MHNNILNQSKLTLEQVKKLNQLNIKSKKKIERFLEFFYTKANLHQNWILSPLMSRDRVQCRLYADLNFLELVDFYVKKKKIKKLIVNNFLLKKIIDKKYKNLNTESSHVIKNILLDVFVVFKSFLKVVLCSFLMMINKKESRKKNFIGKKIILIETFFINSLFKNNYFQERYHQDIYKKFPLRLKKISYFFPINLSIFSIKKFLNIIKKSNLKFIHPLDFLKFEDYKKSIFFNTYLKLKCKSRIKYKNYELDNLINYYKFLSNFNFSSFLANINFFFLKRLNQNHIKIDFMIDWYENQILDKGLSLGKNTFYPESKLKGHIGFLNDFRSVHYYTPIQLEKNVNALPDELLLISKKITNIIFNNLKFIKKKIVPAVRNKKLFNVTFKNKENKNQSKKVLVVLSSNFEETIFIRNILMDFNSNSDFKNYNFIIKPHVNTPSKFFNNNKYIISYKSFYDLLNEADIVVSGGTTATIEAIIMNKKIILIGNPRDITLNPLIIQNKNQVEICYSSSQFVKSLKKLSLKKNKNMINRRLLNLYFTKDKKYFKNFYN